MRQIIKLKLALFILTALSCVSFAQAQEKSSVAEAKPAAASKQSKPDATVQQPQSGGAESQFDHTKTGFILRDVHTTLRCEQCHVDAIFKNTPKNCAGCHSLGSRVGATPKPVNHIQTTLACDTCHNSPTSFLVRHFNHPGIVNGCATCHNSQSLGVMSRPANHFPTALPCESCHTNTNTFMSWRMDHTGIFSNCSSCHGAASPYAGIVKVPTMPALHIQTTADCGTCHNTTTFLGAIFDHVGVAVGSCDSCHMGQQSGVVAKPVAHIPTLGAKCDGCHTTAVSTMSFLGVSYHQTVGTPSSAGVCSSCHTGQFPGALGKPSFHIATTAQCDTCHTSINTSNFKTFFGAVYNHVPAPAVGSCGTCHNGVSARGKTGTHITTTGACDTCHTTALATYSWLGATYVHSPSPPTQACATCHNGSTALGKPAWHMVTTGACDSCHPTAITSIPLSFVGGVGAPDHTGFAVTSCATGACHNGSNAKGLSAGHIPTGTLSCGYCHAKFGGAVTTFYPGTMDHTQVASTRCYACHNGSYVSQGINTGGAVTMPANHIPIAITGGTGGLECTTCHTSATSKWSTPGGATSWLPEKMNHNGAVGGGAPIYCVTCHLTGTSYLVPGGFTKKNHNGSSTAKDCSRTSCHKPLGTFGSSYIKWN